MKKSQLTSFILALIFVLALAVFSELGVITVQPAANPAPAAATTQADTDKGTSAVSHQTDEPESPRTDASSSGGNAPLTTDSNVQPSDPTSSGHAQNAPPSETNTQPAPTVHSAPISSLEKALRTPAPGRLPMLPR